MKGFKLVLGLLFILMAITSISLLGNQTMAQTPGVTPIDPQNVTNQTLQGYPTEDKDISTGVQND